MENKGVMTTSKIITEDDYNDILNKFNSVSFEFKQQ